MITNYLKIAFRNLVKNKTYSLINIVGLAMGMSVSVLILMFVMHEFSFDKFHEKHARIYRILAKIKMGDQDLQMNSFSAKLGPALKEYNPQVENFVRVKDAVDKIVMKNPARGEEAFYEQNFLFTDPSFFKLFSFKIKDGSAASLDRPFTMVISERAAKKYFGDENPVGKSLTYEGKYPMQIIGVAENPPSNSSFDFDFVASAVTYPQLNENNKKEWDVAGIFDTWLLLDSDQSVAAVEKNIKREGEKTGAFASDAEYQLENLATIHLGNNFNESGNTKLIYIFTGVAVLILLLALFNYMSLTTARATLRAKEVGVRKVVGANRGGLVRQFYVESILLCSVAFALAFMLVQLLRHPFYDLLNLRIGASFLFSPSFLGYVIGLLLVSALIAGSYPALVLSGFAPLEVLRGRLAGRQSSAGVRRFFMVLQFTVSIILIICSLVVRNQLNYMQTKKLGLYKEQILSIPLSSSVADSYFPLRNEIRDQVGVQNVAATNVGLFKGYNMFFLKNRTTQLDVPLVTYSVDPNFTEILGLRWKTKPDTTLWKNQSYMVLNETAIKEMGIKGDPIGQELVPGSKVAGVLKDFHFSSIQSEIRAMGLFVSNDTTNLVKALAGRGELYVRLDPKTNIQEKIATIGKIFKKYDQEKPFEYYFLDDAFNETFKTEIRMSTMFTIFTSFAVFIACMGLFGLAAFTAETRTKEIGIRKVLGASVSGIVALLSKDFLKLVLVAVVIASPIAWYAMSQWLADFAYRIDIEWWMFALAGGLGIGIAILTVSFQSVKAALMNPVKSLRSE
ncbi:ABC transporter permease [Arundinibacter roseus]|uniref:ABC transporter permease n=1 Tax=Arundinibacter roseus TaxID=2070510 RepID=A0A4R4K8H3_9BACT|nr:ABC transporter permease [Arundinibacter roseus]TDB62741.1 ABC transporter permease [Arundinibacter roseus]